MALTSLGLLLLLSTLLYGQTEGNPKPVLKLEPDGSLIFIGENVTLSCEIKEGSVFDWTYTWRHNKHDIMTDSVESDYMISSVEWSHGGEYVCIGRRLTDGPNSDWSSSVTLTVQALPTATVRRSTPQGAVYPGDTVTLQCDISEHEDWSYKWFRDGQPLTNENKKTITLHADDAGSYTCEGSRGDRPTKSQLSDNHSIIITATMTIEQTPVYTGETVTLRCSAGPSSDWRYRWYRGSTDTETGPEVVKSTRHTINGDSLTISEATHTDQGYYRCYGSLSPTPITTSYSAASYLTVKVLPTATVRRSTPQGAVYPGDTVTLQCDISEYNNWSYKWFRDGRQLTNEKKKTVTLSADAEASYTCEGEMRDRPVKSQSTIYSIVLTALPAATLSVTPTSAYTGETVTLRCSVEGSHFGWTYTWFKGNKNPLERVTGNTLTIREAKYSDQDTYWCQGQRWTRPRSSIKSNDVTVSMKDNKPRANLMSDNTAVFTGGRVTLTCSVGESSGWRFYWYRHSTGSDPVSESTEGLYTFTPSSVSEGGEFWCRGGRGDPVYYTEYSQPISINVTARPYTVLTLKPNWTQIYIGETVTLRCEMKGTEDFTNWKYTWYKDGTNMNPISTTESEYKFNPKGTTMLEFTCRGVRDLGHSETSEPVRLTVFGKLHPVLRVSPSWLNPGDSVTLTCEVEVSSTDWRFYWYKTVPYKAELPSLADQSYSVEPLLDSDHGTGESAYILHGATHTAGYVCRAGRGQPVYHSDYSERQFLWSGDQHPSVSLTVNPNRTHTSHLSLSL